MTGGSGIMDSQSGEGLDTERGGNEVNSPTRAKVLRLSCLKQTRCHFA